MHKILFLFIVLFSLDVHATCFPKNRLWISARVSAAGISEAQFNEVLDQVEAYYAPIVASRGAKLQINRLWKDGTVNSDASQPGNGTYVINSYGGLARYAGMTVDGYQLVACHEMGHHLGGAPKFGDADWASIEGQADYFADLKCIKAMGKSEAEIQAANIVLAKVLAELGGEPVPSISKHDPSVVRETYEEHPHAQCRLDTYQAGMNCKVNEDLSDTDAKAGTCYDYIHEDIGNRPLCWYKPL
jgi:hypothetical protein